MIIRNKKAEQIINELIENNEIEVVKQLEKKEIIDSQKSVLQAKKGNLHENKKYKMFFLIIDLIYYLKLYRIFNVKVYNRIASYYLKLCRESLLKM